MNGRTVAFLVIAVVTLAIAGFTALGASPGHNKHRFLLEVLVFAVASSALLAFSARPRWRAAGLALGFPALMLLAVLTLPPLRETRMSLLAPALPTHERGFVLAALGPPDLVDDGIGVATVYGYRSDAQILVVRFDRSLHIDDPIIESTWMDGGRAIETHSLHPPLLSPRP